MKSILGKVSSKSIFTCVKILLKICWRYKILSWR